MDFSTSVKTKMSDMVQKKEWTFLQFLFFIVDNAIYRQIENPFIVE